MRKPNAKWRRRLVRKIRRELEGKVLNSNQRRKLRIEEHGADAVPWGETGERRQA